MPAPFSHMWPDDVAHALVRAVSRLFSTLCRCTGNLPGPGAGMSAGAARTSHRTTALLAVLIATVAYGATPPRLTVPFDPNWRFFRGDAQGAQDPDFDDPYWAILNLPHDWSIEGPFDQKNPAGGAGAFLPTGVGWYRKHFLLPGFHDGQRLFLEFDGVMGVSDVWVNGAHLGRRPNGSVSFQYELTPHLHFTEREINVVAVRVDNAAQPASRWYAGSGIYRHVRLVITRPIHLAHWSTVVTTPHVSAAEAAVHVAATVVNQSAEARDVSLQVAIVGSDGQTVETAETGSQSVAPGGSAGFQKDLVVRSPQLWDLEHPALYAAVVRVRSADAAWDEETTSFGIREFHFDAATGFHLNGKPRKILGVCLHQDAGALGAAVPLGIWERRLKLLKQFGVNAIRTAHNPAAPEFLDLCDRMGFLVMEEAFDTWKSAKTPYDYHLYFDEWSKIDVRDMVLRDRNHPGIVLYSAGNEIRDTPNAESAKATLQSLLDVFHLYDPARPVTQALFRPNVSHDYDDGLADMLDVVGQNYREDEILAAHEAKPSRKIIGTENGHDLKVWLALRDHPAYAGQFLWSGFDYLGESRAWPAIGAGSGLFDRTGRPRPRAFQRMSWWSAEPMVYIARRAGAGIATPADPAFDPLERRPDILSDWTPSDRSPHIETVEVYSNCETVELLLNGKSLGSRPKPADDSPRTWRVQFEPGTVQAIARNQGQVAAKFELRTAGKPARVALAADRETLSFNWDDTVYLTATIVDENGVPVPGATNPVTFQGRGPAYFAAVDNGDNSSHESFRGLERKAYDGQCIAILKANAPAGKATMTASAAGLAASTVTIEVATPRR